MITTLTSLKRHSCGKRRYANLAKAVQNLRVCTVPAFSNVSLAPHSTSPAYNYYSWHSQTAKPIIRHDAAQPTQHMLQEGEGAPEHC